MQKEPSALAQTAMNEVTRHGRITAILDPDLGIPSPALMEKMLAVAQESHAEMLRAISRAFPAEDGQQVKTPQ